jgi:hypothetical protein
MSDALPTPRTTLHCRYVRVLLICWSCKNQGDADLALIAAGRGNTPLVHLCWRCASAAAGPTDLVATGGACGRPW